MLEGFYTDFRIEKMKILYDKQIRQALILRLNKQNNTPKAIIEELRVHNGNAIADVVALYKEAHCYEIKGDGDKIQRAVKQGYSFNLAFRKITIVTTSKHLRKAMEVLPHFWGIMIAEEKNDAISLRYVRRALKNPTFDKKVASLTLWKEEMLALVDEKDSSVKRKNRAFLANLISQCKRKKELSNAISNMLLRRYYRTQAGV